MDPQGKGLANIQMWNTQLSENDNYALQPAKKPVIVMQFHCRVIPKLLDCE